MIIEKKIQYGVLSISCISIINDASYREMIRYDAYIPVKNISHLTELLENGIVYTVIHLANGEKEMTQCTLKELVQCFNDAYVMDIFGDAGHRQVGHKVTIKGSDLKIASDSTANLNGPDFTKGCMVPPQAMDATISSE